MKRGVIYKITSPTGRIYIGKTVNFKSRMNSYKNLHNPTQRLIFNSIKKHGWDTHKVTILESCDFTLLNELEIKYIEKEKSFIGMDKMGMNLTLERMGVSEEKIPRKLKEKELKNILDLNELMKQKN